MNANPRNSSISNWQNGLPSLSDDELMAECLAGNDFAFELLTRRYRTRVGGVIADLVDSPDDVDDLIQDTLVRAFRHRRRCPPTGFQPWLIRIAVNCARNYRDSWLRRIRLFVAWDDLPESAQSDGAYFGGRSPDNMARGALRHIQRDALRKALRLLPARQREVFVLKELEGLSYPAIADLLQSPLGTVRSDYSRALIKLRGRLQPMHPEVQL